MRCLQQIQDLRCSQKMLQGQAESLQWPVLSISIAVELKWTARPVCAFKGVQTLLSSSSSSKISIRLAQSDLRLCDTALLLPQDM